MKTFESKEAKIKHGKSLFANWVLITGMMMTLILFSSLIIRLFFPGAAEIIDPKELLITGSLLLIVVLFCAGVYCHVFYLNEDKKSTSKNSIPLYISDLNEESKSYE